MIRITIGLFNRTNISKYKNIHFNDKLLFFYRIFQNIFEIQKSYLLISYNNFLTIVWNK